MKIPVTIIAGFLGSGKTTAIIKLLENKGNDEQWAVIINEFGKVSIDGQTLKSNTDSETVFEISGGCICCSAKGYFQENLEKILQSGDYSRILIEPSGLGGIDMVSEIVEQKSNLTLMPVVCLVDIRSIENPRFQHNPIYRTQIAKADILLFSKCDLLSEEEIHKLIEEFKLQFPEKQNCLSTENNLLDALQNYESRTTEQEKRFRRITKQENQLTDKDYQEKSFLFSSTIAFDIDKLTRLFNKQPSIVRAKGHVQTRNGWFLINYTLTGCLFEPCSEKTQNELIFIVEKSNSQTLQTIDLKINNAIDCDLTQEQTPDIH